MQYMKGYNKNIKSTYLFHLLIKKMCNLKREKVAGDMEKRTIKRKTRKNMATRRMDLKNAPESDIIEFGTNVLIKIQEGGSVMDAKGNIPAKEISLLQLEAIILRNNNEFALKVLMRAINLERIIHK